MGAEGIFPVTAEPLCKRPIPLFIFRIKDGIIIILKKIYHIHDKIVAVQEQGDHLTVKAEVPVPYTYQHVFKEMGEITDLPIPEHP